ncbi:uncharacterized protein LOC117320066 [Pecten maximus]|uniref:uncharacterized protein LOC117320066 n=1 Tax=Pecten maximus TaxID=6579 RepID=UPI0014585F39|nr:uncharacterized protein LOC117320066 [Pecten maximus]
MMQLEKHVFECFEEDIRCSVDPGTITTALFKQGDIDQTLFDDIHAQIREGKNRDEIWKILFLQISSCCSFANVWKALHSSGYEYISIKLLLTYWQRKFQSGPAQGPSNTEGADKDYFLRLKKCFHDQAIKEPHKFLQERSDKFKKKYESADSDKDRKSHADRYADCLCILIDTQAMAFTEQLPSHDMFDRLKSVIPATSNPLVIESAYYSRLAIAYGMVGKFAEGREFMTQAQMAAFQGEQNAQYVYNMLYIHIHFICMEVDTPTSDDINIILDLTKRFLQSLSIHDEKALFWRKMTVLRITCFLIGISHKGVINKAHRVEKKHVSEAKHYLAIIDENWEGIEDIRKLFYYVCKARIQELELQFVSDECDEGDIKPKAVDCLYAAVLQLDKTIAEDPEGNFRETPLASKYSRWLHEVIQKARE